MFILQKAIRLIRSIGDEQMDGGSDGPMCRSKRNRDRGDRKLGFAAQERDDDAQPASGVMGVKI